MEEKIQESKLMDIVERAEQRARQAEIDLEAMRKELEIKRKKQDDIYCMPLLKRIFLRFK